MMRYASTTHYFTLIAFLCCLLSFLFHTLVDEISSPLSRRTVCVEKILEKLEKGQKSSQNQLVSQEYYKL